MQPHYHQKDIIDILAAIAPAVAVLVAITVAITQYLLQKAQAKQDLFEKRYEVYSAVIDLWLVLRRGAACDSEVVYIRLLPAEYLFGNNVKVFIEGIKSRLFRIDHSSVPAERTRIRADLIKHIADNIEPVFKDYLQIHYDKNWFMRFSDWLDSKGVS